MRILLLVTVISFISIACQTTKIISDTSSNTTSINEVDIKPIPQPPTSPENYKNQPVYRAEDPKIFDLLHTKLEVSFDWEKRHLLGLATLQLQPYFYPQSTLLLDAKGFDIHSVKMLDGMKEYALDYEYDGKVIDIKLDSLYTKSDIISLQIDYTAKPYELKVEGSKAISDARGLYFINHDGSEAGKPRQIWTQGETESSSCWFPTLDAPNQRCTQEIYITVEKHFKTLSNGDLVFARVNNDGTRTDYWKMDKPHAPYLFMMAIGEFAVVEDQWSEKDIPVNYYVEPEYERYAKDIFGDTPAMMTFFSDLLDYPYPWSKYSQVVVRDYVSGAMENTTASVFMEELQVTDRELIDKNWDYIIAHELIHQWFGDLVTCESWANLTLNEGFANYSEYLWERHENGEDYGQFKLHDELQLYLNEAETKKVDLIRFQYDDKEDMFDNHSYAKGGLVLHMLNTIVGEEAFFASLNHYLTTHQYSDVEIHDLRLSFETVTGQDLNWFFNQWFLDDGHPVLKVEDHYVDSLNTLILKVWQNQDLTQHPLYELPVQLSYWVDGQKTTETILIEDEYSELRFNVDKVPELVIFDSQEYLVAEIDHKKSFDNYIHQTQHAENALTRYKALNNLVDLPHRKETFQVFRRALGDAYYENRLMGLNFLSNYEDSLVTAWSGKLYKLALEDPESEVRAEATMLLGDNIQSQKVRRLLEQATKDSSYLVAGGALYLLLEKEGVNKDSLVARFMDDENINIVLPLANYFVINQDTARLQWFRKNINNSGTEKLFYMLRMMGQYLINAPEDQKIEGANFLHEIALHHNKYYIRISAYQSLELLADNPEIQDLIADIKSKETDERVRNYF